MNINKTKKWYFNEAKRLGYRGPLRWTGSTKEQWKEEYDKLNPLPEYHDDRERRIDNEPPLFAERIDPNDINIRRVRFPMEDILGDTKLTEDNLDTFKEAIEGYFYEVFNQVNHLNPKYQIAVTGNGRTFSTHYTDDIRQLFFEINAECDRYAREYDTGFDDNLNVEFIDINYIIGHEEQIKGMYKTITEANEKWFILDTRTRKNCVYIAIYTALNWQINKSLLTDSQLRIKNSKMWKKRMQMKDDAPTLSDIDLIARKSMCTVKVYNNIFEHVVTFSHGNTIVSIQVLNCHAKALILRTELTEIAPEFNIQYEIENATRETRKESFAHLQKIFPKNTSKTHDTKIVAWDIETYVVAKSNTILQPGADREFRVYCSGLAYYKDFKPTNKASELIFQQFFGDEDNLKQLITYIKEHIDTLSDCTFYAHNGGKFDLVLLLRDVLSQDSEIEIIGRKMVELNNSFIGLSIKYKNKTIHFKDSYRMFQSSLKAITRDMKVNTPKGEIDHNLITATSYIGYAKEIKEYHRADCVGLLECLTILSAEVFKEFQLNITECFTAASLSKKIIMSKYFKPKHGVYRLDSTNDNFIRNSYQGGRNECFQLGEVFDVYYYDFTSLYPHAGTFLLPTGVPTTIDCSDKSIDQVLREIPIGFIECTVIGTKEMLNGKLPLHGIVKNSRLIFPYISTPTTITLFSQEIKEGLKCGYSYQPVKAVAFQREYLLKSFFEECFQKKSQAKAEGNPALTYMWKIIINSGYGFWGYNPYNKDTIKLYNHNSGWMEYFAKNRLKALNKIGKYTLARVSNDQQTADTNVAIASAITSYARIVLHRAITDIMSAGGKIYYCDTDSVMTDLNLSAHPELVKKYRSDGIGEMLGGLKNELGLIDGTDLEFSSLTIVGCKMYSLTGYDPRTQRLIEINKLKGYKDASKETIDEMDAGGVSRQIQVQFLCNKNDYCRDGLGSDSAFNIRVASVEKKFKKLYSKGKIESDGTGNTIITPFTI